MGRPNPLFSTRTDSLRDRLVVVTDHLTTQPLVHTALEAQHARVVSAAGDAETLAVARSARPDLIVACIDSAATDGFAVTQLLKADPETAIIPVLALTRHPTPDLHNRAQATGFDALLIEPLTGDAFAHVASLLIERSALLRERSERVRQSAADLVRRSEDARSRFQPAAQPPPPPTSVTEPVNVAHPAASSSAGVPVSPRCRRCGNQGQCELVRTTVSSITYRCGSCGQQWRFTLKRPAGTS